MRPQPGFSSHVAHLGTGPRKVLALHCTLAFSGAWAALTREMGQEATFVAPDMPSHGRSVTWDAQSSFADTVYQASLACLTEPMDVVGHSFGGVTALRLAVEHPELVRSVTMIEPVFFCIAKRDAPQTTAEQAEMNGPFYAAVEAGHMEEAARLFNRTWADGPPWGELPEQVRAAMTRAIHVVPDTHGVLFDDTADLIPRLHRARMPALLVRGGESKEIVVATNRGLARRMPQARDVVIEGAGHMAPVSHPAAMAELLRGLWSEMSEEVPNAVR